MADALIIDACRTPRGVGKAGKGALSGIHPQQLGATVLRALADRTGIDTADVDDIVWGCSAQVATQSGDLGRMSALDAGYDVRASAVTLDRFCGSGITSVNMAAASIMSGTEDLVIAGGCEMMSMEGRRGGGPMMMDSGNLRLRARHPQSHQGVCADAIATLEGITRQDVDALGLESQKRAAQAIAGGHFKKSLVPVHREDGSLALDHEEYPRPQTTMEGLSALKPAFPAIADYALDDKGTTYRGLILQKYPDLNIDFMHHAGNSSGVVDGAAAILLASPAYASAHGLKPRASCHRDGQYGGLADPDAERAGAGHAQGAGEGGALHRRHRPVRDQRGLCGGGGKVHPRPQARPRQGQRQWRLDRTRPSHRRHRLDPDRHRAR
ncbi:acetyl-CoA C-acetyltransferase [Bradyrhizobium sp. i1.4.4]